jgi:hypothetical protein
MLAAMMLTDRQRRIEVGQCQLSAPLAYGRGQGRVMRAARIILPWPLP